jgi:hypothetical protein
MLQFCYMSSCKMLRMRSLLGLSWIEALRRKRAGGLVPASADGAGASVFLLPGMMW